IARNARRRDTAARAAAPAAELLRGLCLITRADRAHPAGGARAAARQPDRDPRAAGREGITAPPAAAARGAAEGGLPAITKQVDNARGVSDDLRIPTGGAVLAVSVDRGDRRAARAARADRDIERAVAVPGKDGGGDIDGAHLLRAAGATARGTAAPALPSPPPAPAPPEEPPAGNLAGPWNRTLVRPCAARLTTVE